MLRPGGSFLFNVWTGIEQNEFAAVVTEAVGALYPDDPPLFLARTPHGHGVLSEIEAEIAAAGFEACESWQRDDVSAAPDAESPAVAYCHGTPLRNEIETREPGGLARATAAAAEALRCRFGNGPVEGRMSAVVVSAS